MLSADLMNESARLLRKTIKKESNTATSPGEPQGSHLPQLAVLWELQLSQLCAHSGVTYLDHVLLPSSRE